MPKNAWRDGGAERGTRAGGRRGLGRVHRRVPLGGRQAASGAAFAPRRPTWTARSRRSSGWPSASDRAHGQRTLDRWRQVVVRLVRPGRVELPQPAELRRCPLIQIRPGGAGKPGLAEPLVDRVQFVAQPGGQLRRRQCPGILLAEHTWPRKLSTSGALSARRSRQAACRCRKASTSSYPLAPPTPRSHPPSMLKGDADNSGLPLVLSHSIPVPAPPQMHVSGHIAVRLLRRVGPHPPFPERVSNAVRWSSPAGAAPHRRSRPHRNGRRRRCGPVRSRPLRINPGGYLRKRRWPDAL